MPTQAFPRCVLVIVGAALLCAGCASERVLMPTPRYYTGDDPRSVFERVPPARRTPTLDLLYLTNRAQVSDAASLSYGAERSRSVAFGRVEVELGPGLDWETLSTLSTQAQRDPEVSLRLAGTTEIGRFPPSPYRLKQTPAGSLRSPDTLRLHVDAERVLAAEVQRRLAQSPRKEVVLYVHGFNESFESAAFTLAELCHFLGREQLCALYSWPAGSSGGLLWAYGHDRESGEYSVGHLKRALRLLAQSPGVERVYLLAHSRGSDILLQAIRELLIEAYAAGKVPSDEYRIADVVLLAPDIDVEVAEQRLSVYGSDPSMLSPWRDRPMPRAINGKLTVYSSPSDRALLASGWLFGSRARLGRLQPQQLDRERRAYWRASGVFQLIEVPRKRVDFLGHGYFTTDPAVSADLIGTIRYGLEPGEPGRPMRAIDPPIIWAIDSPAAPE